MAVKVTNGPAHLDESDTDARCGWGRLVPSLSVAVAIAVAAMFLFSVEANQASGKPALYRGSIAPGEFIYPVGAVVCGRCRQGGSAAPVRNGPFLSFGFRSFREPLKGRVAQRESTTLTS